MKGYFPVAALVISLIGTRCSSEKAEKAAPAKDTLAARALRPPGEPTSIKRNGMMVVAAIESVAVLDSVRYKLIVRLKSAISPEGMDSPAGEGERLTLIPEYALDPTGAIDPSVARNTRLKSLSSVRPGDQFKGTISLTANRWVIVDVGNQ